MQALKLLLPQLSFCNFGFSFPRNHMRQIPHEKDPTTHALYFRYQTSKEIKSIRKKKERKVQQESKNEKTKRSINGNKTANKKKESLRNQYRRVPNDDLERSWGQQTRTRMNLAAFFFLLREAGTDAVEADQRFCGQIWWSSSQFFHEISERIVLVTPESVQKLKSSQKKLY